MIEKGILAKRSGMQGPDYYISDLHLSEEKTGINQLFSTFLKRDLVGARSLTIGGDFFNFYYGIKQFQDPYYHTIGKLLQDLVQAGTKVDFVIGNRDFLFWRDCARYSLDGFQLYAQRELISECVIMHHGDTFCLDDKAYLRFRRLMHLLPLHALSRIVPGSFARGIARYLRGASKRKRAKNKQHNKQEDAEDFQNYYDIKDQAVIPFITEQACDTLVCGHIHRPQERHYNHGKRKSRLLVLGEWQAERAVIARALPGEKLQLVELKHDGIEAWEHEIQNVKIPE